MRSILSVQILFVEHYSIIVIRLCLCSPSLLRDADDD